MKTASFFTFAGPGRVSIARFPPRGVAPSFRVFKALAPGPWFQSPRPEYERRFADQLAGLDPLAVWNRLHDLAGAHEPVLLCWERPPFTATNWCHRRIVADWFVRHGLALAVPEFTPQGARDVDPAS